MDGEEEVIGDWEEVVGEWEEVVEDWDEDDWQHLCCLSSPQSAMEKRKSEWDEGPPAKRLATDEDNMEVDEDNLQGSSDYIVQDMKTRIDSGEEDPTSILLSNTSELMKLSSSPALASAMKLSQAGLGTLVEMMDHVAQMSRSGSTISLFTPQLPQEEASPCPFNDKEIHKMLSDTFGFTEFKPGQMDVVRCALRSIDYIAIFPTGGGKSLCFQLPAVMTPGVTIVISPLISLMIDQVEKLVKLGIPAARLSSDMNAAAQRETIQNIAEERLKLVYITPERMVNSEIFLSVLNVLYGKRRLARFVVDEAHTISQWGSTFRKDYGKLGILRETFPEVPIMALTATATLDTEEEIIRQLKMAKPYVFRQPLDRPNLRYHVVSKTRVVDEDLIRLLKSDRYRGKTGLVYCFSQKECEDTQRVLERAELSAKHYHGGLSKDVRTQVQDEWMKDKTKILCCTVAFGMGIDKSNVRYVIHKSPPPSIESYSQESGRAGRDGEMAECVIFYRVSDVFLLRGFLQRTSTDEKRLQQQLKAVDDVAAYCQNRVTCRRSQLLSVFGETDHGACQANPDSACDNCLRSEDVVETKDYTSSAQKIFATILGMSKAPTVIQVASVLKGEISSRLQFHKSMSQMTRNKIEDIIWQLVEHGFIKAKAVTTQRNHFVSLSATSMSTVKDVHLPLPIPIKNDIEDTKARCFWAITQECKKEDLDLSPLDINTHISQLPIVNVDNPGLALILKKYATELENHTRNKDKSIWISTKQSTSKNQPFITNFFPGKKNT